MDDARRTGGRVPTVPAVAQEGLRADTDTLRSAAGRLRTAAEVLGGSWWRTPPEQAVTHPRVLGELEELHRRWRPAREELVEQVLALSAQAEDAAHRYGAVDAGLTGLLVPGALR